MISRLRISHTYLTSSSTTRELFWKSMRLSSLIEQPTQTSLRCTASSNHSAWWITPSTTVSVLSAARINDPKEPTELRLTSLIKVSTNHLFRAITAPSSSKSSLSRTTTSLPALTAAPTTEVVFRCNPRIPLAIRVPSLCFLLSPSKTTATTESKSKML